MDSPAGRPGHESDDTLAEGAPKRDLADICLPPEASIRAVLEALGRNQVGIVLLVDADGRLLATATDGDLRRAILAGVPLEEPLGRVIERRQRLLRPAPVTAPYGTSPAVLLELMRTQDVRQIPLLGEDGRVLDLRTLEDLTARDRLPVRALVMAGGFGTRMLPLTRTTPKPMLPVGGRPVLERTIEHLALAGIRDISISTHHLYEQIVDHFGGGERFGVTLRYLHEQRPLGTAGALALLDRADAPILLVNGDIVTGLDFRAMLDYHREHRAMLTVAVRKYGVEVPYGVVEARGATVTSVIEKPAFDFLVNAGVYVLEAGATSCIPAGERFDMTELMEKLLEDRRSVVAFPVVEQWIDIGKPVDYALAQSEAREAGES